MQAYYPGDPAMGGQGWSSNLYLTLRRKPTKCITIYQNIGYRMIRLLVILTILLSAILYPGCTSSSDAEKENIDQYIVNTIVPLFKTEYSITGDRRIILHTFTYYSKSEFFKILDDLEQREEQLHRDYQKAVRDVPDSLFNAMKKLEESSELVVQAHTIYHIAFNQTDINLLNQYAEEGDALVSRSEHLKQEAISELIDTCNHYGIDIYEYYDVGRDLRAEHQHVQTAVSEMIVASRTPRLDASYDEIDELAEVQGVTAEGGAYKLDDYIFGYVYPLMQAYDISRDGEVTVD